MGNNVYCFLKGRNFMFNLYITPIVIKDGSLKAILPDRDIEIAFDSNEKAEQYLQEIYERARKGTMFIDFEKDIVS